MELKISSREGTIVLKNTVVNTGLERMLQLLANLESDSGFNKLVLCHSTLDSGTLNNQTAITDVPTNGTIVLEITGLTAAVNYISPGRYELIVQGTANLTSNITFNEVGLYVGFSTPVLFAYTAYPTEDITLPANTTQTFTWTFNFIV